MSAEERYREAKKRREELEHAKNISDKIGDIIGLPTATKHTVQFPGLAQAQREENEAYRAWRDEQRSS